MTATDANRIYVGGGIFRTAEGSVPGWGLRTRGDRIDAVLPDADLRAGADADTEIVELDGRFVSPGFIDAHFHPTVGGVEAGLCDLSETTSLDECLAAIEAYALTHPDAEWIVGGGWTPDFFPGGNPRRETLDAVTGGRPALLANRDHHSHWANSTALHMPASQRRQPTPSAVASSATRTVRRRGRCTRPRKTWSRFMPPR